MLVRSVVALLLAGGLLAGCGGGTSTSASRSASSTGGPVASATPGTVTAPTTSAPPPGGSDAQVVDLTVHGGQVTGPTGRQEVPLGSDVVLRVTSDVADEVHVHGYDESVDLVAGRRGEVRFTAGIPGSFEVELERSGTQLARLLVR